MFPLDIRILANGQVNLPIAQIVAAPSAMITFSLIIRNHTELRTRSIRKIKTAFSDPMVTGDEPAKRRGKRNATVNPTNEEHEMHEIA